jgi:hypothetical protein
MTLLAPLGLLALLTLPVIIILHFRRERLRRVVVPSLLLWQHMTPETGKHRKFMLPLSLLLLLHLLAAALLALALSQPLWLSRLLSGGQQDIALIIDTSTSMGAREGPGVTRLDQARDIAVGLINNLEPGNSIAIITADTQAQLLANGGAAERAGLIQQLNSLEASGTGTDIAAAFALAQAAPTSSGAPAERVVVISDSAPPQDTTLPPDTVEWRQIGSTTNNRAIVTLAAEERRTGTPVYDVYARVTNYDTQPATTALRLFGDDELLSVQTVELQPSGDTELTWEVPAEVQSLRAELDGGDALPADDVAVLALGQVRTIRAALVSEEAAALERALQAVPSLEVTTVAPEGYANAPAVVEADLLIFDGVLPEAWPVGGTLIVNPPIMATELLTIEAGTDTPLGIQPIEIVEPEAGVDRNPLEGLGLGSVSFGTLPRVQPPAWMQPLAQAGDIPLILRGRTGESDVAIWAFDMQQTNLPSKLAFPLLVARTVTDLTAPTPVDTLLVGEALTLAPTPRTERLELLAPDGSTRTIPVTTTVRLDNLYAAGMYTLREYAGETLLTENRVSVNTGTPLESDLRTRPLATTATPYVIGQSPPAEQDTTSERQPGNQTEPLWPWLAATALGVILLEWIYVHWR